MFVVCVCVLLDDVIHLCCSFMYLYVYDSSYVSSCRSICPYSYVF